jgi:hypothetical protein
MASKGLDQLRDRSKRGVKFKNPDALWAAVEDAVAAEWHELAGRDITSHDRANFLDRVLPEHETRARAVTARLSEAVADAKRFANDYRLKSQRRMLEEPAGDTRGLLTYIELHLPSLIGEHVPLATLHKPTPDGWRVEMRGRVVSLLGRESLGYWEHLGLASVPTHRTMALATLQLGCRPTLNRRDFSVGVTVSAVIEREMNAIRAQEGRRARKPAPTPRS